MLQLHWSNYSFYVTFPTASFLQGDSKRKESSSKTEGSERRKREDSGKKERDKERDREKGREKERSSDQLKVKLEHT